MRESTDGVVPAAGPLTTAPIAPAFDPRHRLLGFHGAVHTTDVPATMSLLDLALSHRSLGVESIAALTDLPMAPAARRPPTSGTGMPIGATSARPRITESGGPPGPVARTMPDGPPSASASPSRPAIVGPEAPMPAADEPLRAYIDRQLRTAQFLPLPNRGRGYAITKRLMDLVGATLLLIVSAPVMLVLAAWIRLDSPGSAIFRQTRVTRGGQTFVFYKFRTMYVDAAERFPDLFEYRQDADMATTYYKLADDPRNTRVGRWLRRTTLDELPNVFNVLRGDISLVGPRPELPAIVRHYRPEEFACFFTKAGLTGLAQVAGRSLLTVRERLTLDLRYVAHQNALLDLRILWRTVIVVLTGRGAF